MPATRAIHARESKPRRDGNYRAVTIVDRVPQGLMVWAGVIHARAIAKPSEQIEPADYVFSECVNFDGWDDVQRYFQDREYAGLIEQLRSGA